MLTVICETPGTLRAEQRDRPARAPKAKCCCA